jgi:1,4-dihydroxy-2-naphthoate octaprenyltransferase
MDFKSFIAATRMPFVAASILPILFTTAYVRETGIDYFLFSLIIIGVFSLHLSANVMNDFIDWDNDGVNENAGKFNGGTRQFVENIVGREQYKIIFNIAMLIGIACVVIISYFRPYAIIPGIVGIVIAYYYSSPPLNLQSRGLGELVLFLAFGPVLTFGTGYVLTDTLSLNHFLIGIPPGLLTTLILWINQFPDYEADKKAGKKNLVVRLGLEKSFNIFMLGQMLVYVSIAFLIITGILPIIAFSLFILAPLSFYIVKQAKMNLNNPKMLESAQEKTVMLQNVALVAMIVIMFF